MCSLFKLTASLPWEKIWDKEYLKTDLNFWFCNSFLVTSILVFFFLFKNIDIYSRLMYKYNVCLVDFQISWCSLEFIHIYTLVYMYMSLLILIYIWISFENLRCTLLQSTCTYMTINSLFFFFWHLKAKK